ncbi:hypothetical protein SAMN04487965_2109 [Microbulbifer donghaiensis]|uniref:Uncharacterized protein n=1 Tax=Microbulbifer donghaiensis TaxID=494016 RepID=A0A1M5CA66_9GAMM|nr:hypothetical protein [Microbulbifer donghaiensis]SHF51332.1 hypothetical protein SAMN04487965_2109 [Microbulbifer donghaiensis]
MSGRKNKHKQRGHERGQSSDLLDELNSLRDLLGSDDIGDIPLLDQVAAPGKPPAPATQAPTPRPQTSLEDIDLPILFSPVDEELPEDYRSELNESDLKLLRPLQDLPVTDGERENPAAKPQPQAAGEAPRKGTRQEQQQELFAEPAATPATENPFLPAHIRARLTGGRVPKSEPTPMEPVAAEVSLLPEEITAAEPATVRTEASAPASPPPTPEKSTLPDAELPEPEPPAVASRTADASERQQLVDRLVAKQLPELERQLRARIELMLDELEARD